MACPIPSEEPVMKIRAICAVADGCVRGVVMESMKTLMRSGYRNR
jgi:hypothetical protein